MALDHQGVTIMKYQLLLHVEGRSNPAPDERQREEGRFIMTIRSFLILLLLTFVSLAVQAATINYAFVCSGATCVESNEPTGAVVNYNDETTAGNVTAGYGGVGAFLTAESVNATLSPGVIASAGGKFEDIVTITGGTGPVPVIFDLVLSGQCIGTGGATGGGFPRSQCGVQARLFGPPWLGLSLTAAGGVSQTVTLNPGDRIGIVADLDVRGTATNGMFTGDFFNTMHVYMSSTTAGIQFIGDSGHSYVAPVPAPATAWLLGSGLLPGLIGVARRRVRR
jgi:hypothetical protein